LQIRIVTNTQSEEKASKKKRYRGYAFIVYEREKDMKGNFPLLFQTPPSSRRRFAKVDPRYKD